MKMRIFLFAAILAYPLVGRAAAAPPSSPRLQFKEAVEQLQKTPASTPLREKIIALARRLKPAPAVPEEARRFLARGNAAFESAKTDDDLKLALPEFQSAADKAPWWPDAYYNLAKVQEKLGDFDSALANDKLCLAADPDGKDAEGVRTLIYKLEFKAEQRTKEIAKKEEQHAWAAAIVQRLTETYGGSHDIVAHLCLPFQLHKTVCTDEDANASYWRVGPNHNIKPDFSVEGENGDRIAANFESLKFCGRVNGSAFESVEWTYCGSDMNELRKGSSAKISLDSWSGNPGMLVMYLCSDLGCKRDWYEVVR